VVERRPVHHPSPQLCCVLWVGGGVEWPWVRDSIAYAPGVIVLYTSSDTVVLDYIQFSKFHTHNGDDSLPEEDICVQAEKVVGGI